jgi:hypothetical protein
VIENAIVLKYGYTKCQNNYGFIPTVIMLSGILLIVAMQSVMVPFKSNGPMI